MSSSDEDLNSFDDDQVLLDRGSYDDDDLDDLERPQAPGTGKDEFGDEHDHSDESTVIEIVEHIDEIDEGYFTPTTSGLVLLGLLVVAVAAIIGYSIYYGYNERNDPSPTPKKAQPPSSAPTAFDDQFLCNICKGGNITILDSLLEDDGNLTCAETQHLGDLGQLTEDQCELAQEAAVAKCGCTIPDSCRVCATGVVQNPDGILDVRSAGFPGINQLTCAQIESFAEAGTIPKDFCPSLQEASAETCDCVAITCSVCANGTVTNPDAIVNVTSVGIPKTSNISCGALEAFVEDGFLPVDSCPRLQEAVLNVCECSGGAVQEADFVCSICKSGEVGEPEAEIEFDGKTITCEELAETTLSGEIDAEQCTAAQLAAADLCGCKISKDDQEVLDLLETVVGPAIFEDGTAEFMAGRYLIEEDPLYLESKEIVIRRLQPFDGNASSPVPATSTVLNRTQGMDEVNATEPYLTSMPVPALNISCPICPDGLPIGNYNGALPADDLPDAFFEFSEINCTELERLSFEDNIPQEACPSIQKLSEDACLCSVAKVIEDGPTNQTESTSDIESAIVQRYLVILLYYQTSNISDSPWESGCDPQSSDPCKVDDKEDGRWLSELTECEWAGITCDDGVVTHVELGK